MLIQQAIDRVENMFCRVILYVRRYFSVYGSLCVALFMILGNTIAAQSRIPADVIKIFYNNCTLCHGGGLANKELDLRSEYIFASAVGQPSQQKPSILRIKPGDPENSYLMMKIKHSPAIEGKPMPPGSDRLPEKTIQRIADWITSLSAETVTTAAPSKYVRAFAGWTVGNTPTTEVLKKGNLLFRISHRFAPKIDKGNNMFGIDGPAIIMFSLGYAITDDMLVTLGRTNAADDIELNARYRLFKETKGEKLFSLAFQTAINWESSKVLGENRLRSDVLMYSLQAIATKNLFDRFFVTVVPGMLINPNTSVLDEDPLITIGFGGRYYLGAGYSIITDLIPIVSGFNAAPSTYGFYDRVKRFDAWTIGVEKHTRGHVFQVFVTNSEGISTDQYMNGGDLDIQNGDVRLGFEIYRIIGL